MIRRRDLVAPLVCAVLAEPIFARAQQTPLVLGFLSTLSATSSRDLLAAFREGLRDAGYVEGGKLAIEYRWAEGHDDRLRGLAADLVARRVAVIVAVGGPASGLAAMAATSTVPIVFASGGDVVKLGLVASLNHPGANVTGVQSFFGAVGPKGLQLLTEIVPKDATLAVLRDPNGATSKQVTEEIAAASNKLGRPVATIDAGAEEDFDKAFGDIAKRHVGGLQVWADPIFLLHRERIVALAAQYRVPTVYGFREFVALGGLMSYGNKLSYSYRQAGIYAGRVLDGEKPADLPVIQPTLFEFVLNLMTAKALGLTIPSGVLAIADEVIE